MGKIQQTTSTPPNKIFTLKTNSGSFNIEEEENLIKLTLINPNVINEERFITQVASQLTRGKEVFIDFGKWRKHTSIVSDELSIGKIGRKIENLFFELSEEKDLEFYAKRLTINPGFFNRVIGKTKIAVLVSTTKKNKTLNISPPPKTPHYHSWSSYVTPIDDSPFAEKTQWDQANENSYVQEDIIDFGNPNSNIVFGEMPRSPFNSKVFSLTKPYSDSFPKLLNIIGGYEQVNIPTHTFNGELDGMGLFLQRDIERDEIKILLNGDKNIYDEELHKNVLLPLIEFFLDNGEKIVIDFDTEYMERVHKFIESMELFNDLRKNKKNITITPYREINPVLGLGTHSLVRIESTV